MKFDKVSKSLIWVAIVLIGLSFLLPYVFTHWSVIDFSNTGQIGDTIGGIMNPFIGIAGVAAMFAAFYMQAKANKLITDQFEKAQFENQFFELLKIHKENSNAIERSTFNGSHGFEGLVNEIHSQYNTRRGINLSKTNEEIFKDAYRAGWRDKFGHYFRHLFLIVKFVTSKEEGNFLTYEQVRFYLRILRASLSTYEQIFLYYNWLSKDYGGKWEDGSNKFFTDYRMIHNINPGLLLDDFKFDVTTPFKELLVNKGFRQEDGRRTNDTLFEFEDL